MLDVFSFLIFTFTATPLTVSLFYFLAFIKPRNKPFFDTLKTSFDAWFGLSVDCGGGFLIRRHSFKNYKKF